MSNRPSESKSALTTPRPVEATLAIVLDGSGAGDGANGLTIQGTAVTVRGVRQEIRHNAKAVADQPVPVGIPVVATCSRTAVQPTPFISPLKTLNTKPALTLNLNPYAGRVHDC